MSMEAEYRCGYVAIAGRPNVGKSTLLNALLGERLAITSHKPQTTRHSLLGVKTTADGQILFLDTPGIHERKQDALNRYLNRAARSAVAGVDLSLFVVEALRWGREDESVLQVLKRHGKPVIVAVNKVDAVADKAQLLPFLEELSKKHELRALVPISARTGTGLEQLENEILKALPVGPRVFDEDQITDRTERFFAAELVREQLTRRFAREIPYAVTVEIEQFVDEDTLYRIAALIWVERPGQKKILIGRDGSALKEVGRQARIEMESLFGRKVFLSLWVKVKKSWSSDEGALARLGYTD